MRIIENKLVVSAYGLHVFDVNEVLAARGVASVQPLFSYPLPYPTYNFDARFNDSNYDLFLASGTQGIEIFSLGNDSQEMPAGLPQTTESVSIRGRATDIVLRTGSAIKHLGQPALNDIGDIAVWAVTNDGKESILRRKNFIWETAYKAGGDVVSLSHPSLNAQGDIAFWAGKRDRREAISVFSNGQVSEIVATGAQFRRLELPEIDDAGSVVFWGESANGTKGIYKYVNGTITYLANVQADGVSYYDVSPNGKIAWVSSEGITVKDGLQQWTLNGTAGYLRRWLRVTDQGLVGFNGYQSELVMYIIANQSTTSVVAAHRNYPVSISGYVGRGMPNNYGESVFMGWSPKFSTSLKDRGVGLYYHNGSAVLQIMQRGDMVQNSSIEDIQFFEGFNQFSQVASSVVLKEPGGQFSQAIFIRQ
jgi:hypothetical protein